MNLLHAYYTIAWSLALLSPSLATNNLRSVKAATVVPKKVIVIGAGISGLSAARTLADSGYNVTVVEGRNRIGGRISTDKTSKSRRQRPVPCLILSFDVKLIFTLVSFLAKGFGVPIELGAEWIHHYIGNPITDLAKKYGVTTATYNNNDNVLYKYDGSKITNQKYADGLYQQVMNSVNNLQNTLDNDITLDAAIAKAEATMHLSASDKLLLQYEISASIEDEYAASPKNLSLFYYNEGSEFKGADRLVTGGYDGIIQGLAKGLKVLLNRVVTKVSYGTGAGVSVVTSTGTITGDYAVVTLPLGVLKKGVVTFSPILPAKKTNAINKLGVGVLNKLWLKVSLQILGRRASSQLRE